jgi:transposase
VARTIKKYLDEKDLVTKNRSGRPKLINDENKKTLKKIVKRNNRKSAEQIKNKFNEKTSISIQLRLLEDLPSSFQFLGTLGVSLAEVLRR